MANIIDYVKEQLKDLNDLSFNQVDSLVLSQYAYIRFDEIFSDNHKDYLIKDMLQAEHFNDMLKYVWAPDENKELLFAMAASPRFRNIKMSHYVNKLDDKTEKQFSAVTYHLNDDLIYLAFRGTDSTIVGWKEDFNMSFTMPVPAQTEALAYLRLMASTSKAKIMLGGHSKGGNLAVYAAMNADEKIKERIIFVYNHDGPGFQETVFNSDGYLAIADRIKKTIPQSSMVGMLLEFQDHYSIVKSKGFWFLQHDPFLWEVNEEDFLYQQHLSNAAKYTNKTINQWLTKATIKERELFIDTLYNVIKSTNAQTLSQLTDNIIQDGKNILGAISDVDEQTKKFVLQTIKDLASISFKNLLPNKKNKGGQDEDKSITDHRSDKEDRSTKSKD
ncbi:MAG: DUF2974 domain-containing protein [Erysipelotrichaceae bacterium]|nr:DUF2974 domain-containing protein [Erysipelotrichaceae bacterium]